MVVVVRFLNTTCFGCFMELPKDAKSGKEIVTFKPPLDESTRKWQLSSTDIIEEARQRLAGYHYSENQQKWTKICEPWMNDDGIGRVTNIMNFYINKNVQLSYLEPEQIEGMTMAFCGELSEFLRFHFSVYDIKKEHIGIIFHMLSDTIFTALQRARFGKESQFIENTEQRTIMSVEGQPQGQHSPLSRIPILGRMAK